MRIKALLLCAACVLTPAHLTSQSQTNAAAIEAETLQHFQALLRIDTSSPPGNETRAVVPQAGVRHGRHSLPGSPQSTVGS